MADEPKSSLDQILKAAGITHVAWIDDLFDPPEILSEASLAEGLATLHAAGIVPAHSFFARLVPGDEVSVWVATGRKLAAQPEDERLAASNAITNALAPLTDQNAEYDGSELDEIIKSFGGMITRYGIKAWNADKGAVLAKSDGHTLFIVDREFRTEGVPSSIVGDTILSEVLTAKAKTTVIVLSHSVGVDLQELEALRVKISAAASVPSEKFAVVSKHATGSSSEAALRGSLRQILTRKTFAHVVDAIAAVLKESIVSTRTQLLEESVYDLDAAVFENSLNEGASEIEVALRILFLRARVGVEEKVSNDAAVLTQLDELRALRRLEALGPAPVRQSSSLVTWRHDEVFDSATRLNVRHAPLALGDLFSGKSEKYCWLLLAQPCDLVVRGDGARKATEATLVKVKYEKPDSKSIDEGDSQRYFRIPAMGAGGHWYVDFLESPSVSLDSLDLAVFNADGVLSYSKELVAPPGMLPGWRVRVGEFKDAMLKSTESRARLMTLSLNKSLPTRGASGQGLDIKFDYKRCGRLRSAWALAAFVAFTAYKTRAAFEHDFAKGLVA